MKSRPIHFLKCLNQFRSHNPFVMAIVCHRHAMISNGQSAPPMRVTFRRWWQNNMECIADIVCKFSIRDIYSPVTGVVKVFGKLKSGNRVFRSAAMRPEQGQVFWVNAGSVTHRQQRRFELLNCGYRFWVAENLGVVCVHKWLQSDAKNKVSSTVKNK